MSLPEAKGYIYLYIGSARVEGELAVSESTYQVLKKQWLRALRTPGAAPEIAGFDMGGGEELTIDLRAVAAIGWHPQKA